MEQNRKATEEILAAANRHDIPATADFLADGFVYENMTMPGQQGKEGFDGTHAALFGAFPDLHYRTVNMVVAGNTCLTECIVTGTHQGQFFDIPATGKSINLPIAFVTTHDNRGLIKNWKSYYDAASLLRQMGAIR